MLLIQNRQSKIQNPEMAAIVQRLERLIVVQDVVGSNPTSRPISIINSNAL